jgi:hypothetical protein
MSLFESTNLIPPLLRIMEEYYGLGFQSFNSYEDGLLGRWASLEYGYEEMVLTGAINSGYLEWAFHLASRRIVYNSSYVAAGRAGSLELIDFMRRGQVEDHSEMLEAAARNGHIHILDNFGESARKYMDIVIETEDWRVFQKFTYRVRSLNSDQAAMIGGICDDVFIRKNMGFLAPCFPIIAEAAVENFNTKAIKGLITLGHSTTNLIRLFIKYDQVQNVRDFMNRSDSQAPPQSALNWWIIEYNALECVEFYKPMDNHKKLMDLATSKMVNLLGLD